jgi:hypothetical protein
MKTLWRILFPFVLGAAATVAAYGAALKAPPTPLVCLFAGLVASVITTKVFPAVVELAGMLRGLFLTPPEVDS